MEKEKIDRINELAKKSRTPQGLTPEEKEEQAVLRRAYIDSYKRSLVSQLENTYYMDENGRKRKVGKKEKWQN